MNQIAKYTVFISSAVDADGNLFKEVSKLFSYIKRIQICQAIYKNASLLSTEVYEIGFPLSLMRHTTQTDSRQSISYEFFPHH